MRKVAATQLAAMTAAVDVYATTVARYSIPLLGLTAANTAFAYDDEELDEVVVTGQS
ncbi:MAG: hypothetical protein ABI821_15160 [Pseudomonadota bacterium]